jgi:hypothetical protein
MTAMITTIFTQNDQTKNFNIQNYEHINQMFILEMKTFANTENNKLRLI